MAENEVIAGAETVSVSADEAAETPAASTVLIVTVDVPDVVGVPIILIPLKVLV